MIKFIVLTVFLLFVPSSIYSEGIPGTTQKKSEELVRWQFYLQPFENTKIFINKNPVKAKLKSRDKTLALLSIPYRDKLLKLKFSRKGFQSIEKEMKLDVLTRNSLPPLFQLMPQNSGHDFVHWFKVGKEPKSVTFIDDKRVAVALLDDSGIDIVDIVTGKKKRITPGTRPHKRHLGYVEALIIKERKELWVSQLSPAAIHVFSLTDYDYLRTIDLKGQFPKFLAYDHGRELVYSANWQSRDVSVIDVNEGKELTRISIGGVPRGLVLSPDESFLYVAQFSTKGDAGGSGRIVKIDLRTRKINKVFGPEGSKRHLVIGNNEQMYVSDMSNSRIEVYDLKKDKLIKMIRVFSKPNTIVLSVDGNSLYVSCRGPNNAKSYLLKGPMMGKIYVIDTKKIKVSSFWEGGNQPTGLDISPDGKYVVTSDFKDNRIRVYEVKIKEGLTYNEYKMDMSD